ncbi:MAG: hypothetical protein NC184_05670 [Roseburia sp.]|nr:hypothetical protein [Roseburia sp.]
MAITLGDAFQNWNPSTNLPKSGATVDGGVIAMLEPNIFRNKVMLPGVTYATDVESLMVDNKFAVAFIRKLDKIKVTMCKATDNDAFRVVSTQTDGDFIEVKCNDVLKVAEIVSEPIDAARVSGQTADKVALASESYDEVKELRYLSYLINGGGSPDPTDVGAPASANTTRSDKTTILDNIIDDRATLRKAGADPDTLILSEDTDAVFLKYLGNRTYFAPASATEASAFGQVFAGTLFSGKVKVFTSNAVGQDNSTLVGAAEKTKEWDWSNIEYILYDHKTLSIINIARNIGLIDYSVVMHNSSLISILTVCGGRIRNTKKAIAKKYATA